MFNFLKKKKVPVVKNNSNIDIELTASLLA